MSNESIELYKPYTPAKMEWPASFQRKLDGVPIRIRKMGGKHTFAYSRQNEVITSVPQIVAYAAQLILEGGSIIGELHIEGMPFKDISGLVRQKLPSKATERLVLHVFDFDQHGRPTLAYGVRRQVFEASLKALQKKLGVAPEDLPIRLVPHVTVADSTAAEHAFKLLMQARPDAEGAVIHSLDKPFRPGTRLWVTQKMKPEPTIDVLVTGFEEAKDKFGVPKDMVGGITIELNTWSEKTGLVKTTTSVGPGALKHAERKVLWAQFKQGKFKPRIAEVKYMKDDTYDGLRQPTFVRWRDDKTDADVRNK